MKPAFRPLLKPLALALALAGAGPALAFQFKLDNGLTGSLDTTLSYGISVRASDRDRSLVGIANGGTARSVNEDDGNLNYGSGKRYSSPLRVTHEFELKRNNLGVFSRGTYFYDFAYADQAVSATSGFGPRGEDRMVAHGELLDLFVYGGFDVGCRRLNARLGQQVVNWGESTFIPNGINAINPVNLARLRAPGSELREALVPQPMLWASQQLTDRLSVEGFYQFRHRRVELDPRGTYFSTNDFISDDGDRAFVGFGRRDDQHGPAGLFGLTPTAQAWAPRGVDPDRKNDGQYGIAVRLFMPELNSTEFGFYFMNYHSRTPLISGVRGAVTVGNAAALAAIPIPGCAPGPGLVNLNALLFALGTPNTANPLGQGPCTAGASTMVRGNYFVEYPRDIRMFGLSFNTAGPAGIALQGEYSYRPNQPVQLASTELLLAALGLANNITGGATAAASVAPGTVIEGYRRVQMHQAQLSATKAFGPTFGAEQFALVGEVGYTHLNLPSNLRFNGPATHLPAPGSFVGASNGASQPGGTGYAT
ncbi:MAG: DUF1302 domain-containing protein, partial [Phycisphaeraceae bacterium]|nr:DUF1302 domain-containing protein [Phycisphaeraceae bacterium]